ncbi:rRNA maturation RNase YbeY [Fibrella aquatilis]|uniref:Endoribonuclease YbeY n=1 Tax=Fibrella aquatilis TaxID=2817059 RepID=A0A939G875_9BACT|nr:rRNA maturation RNase YbeY [Fibrella aquatilis]MBO0932780.1 rRNA maturation RNase YbeY [Fibrella aquatilis]
MVRFFNEDTDFKLPQKLAVKKWLTAQAKAEGHDMGDLNYIFATDEYVLNVNKEYLQHDYYTDIITFDNREYVDDPIEGDIYVSVDRVADNAAQLGIAPEVEMRRVLAHGLLHLCGYGDKTEEEVAVMRMKEEEWLLMYNG